MFMINVLLHWISGVSHEIFSAGDTLLVSATLRAFERIARCGAQDGLEPRLPHPGGRCSRGAGGAK